MGGCKKRLVLHPILGPVFIRRRRSSEDSEYRRRCKAAKKARKRAEEEMRREHEAREEAERRFHEEKAAAERARLEREKAERRFHEEKAAAERARLERLAMLRYQKGAALAMPAPIVRVAPLAPFAPTQPVVRKPEPSGNANYFQVNNPQINIGLKPICHYKLKSGDHCSKAPKRFVLNKGVCKQHHDILHEMKKNGQSVSHMLV